MKSQRDCLTPVLIFIGLCLIIAACWQIIYSWPKSILSNSSTTEPSGQPKFELPFFIPLTQQGGFSPEFSLDGREIYYLTPSGELAQINVRQESPPSILLALPPQTNLIWNEQCDLVLVEWPFNADGKSALGVLEIQDLKLETLLSDAWGATWHPNRKYIAYIHADDNGKWLWKSKINGSNPERLVELNGIAATEYVAWSPQGDRFVIQAALGTSVYSYSDGVAIEINWLPMAEQTIWSPDGWWLAFERVEEDGVSLWKTNQDGNQEELLLDGQLSRARWLPDGRLVYFTPGKEGGAAVWALDPRTSTRELLADSSIVIWKPLDDFTVSPQGNMLVFEAQDRQLWLLQISNLDSENKLSSEKDFKLFQYLKNIPIIGEKSINFFNRRED